MKNLKTQAIKFIAIIYLICLNCLDCFSQSNNYFESSKNMEIFIELYKELDMFYVDEINSGELIKTSIDEMLESLDPYTTYIPESDIEDFRFMTTGKYGGIGAMISKRGEYVIISEPYEGFAAQKAGLISGDKILEVNGTSAKGKNTEELSSILKGSPNTTVNILIHRDKDTLEFSFNRESVQIKSVLYSGFIEDQIGYIKLRSFTRNCANDVKKALIELKQEGELEGLILDLRSNPGGLLNESIDLVNLFVEKGIEIVTTKGKVKDWEKTYKTKYNPIDINIPLVILINSRSASASEIVSGSIQDLDRGVIIGKRSFGKGLVQQTRKLPYNSQLKVTVAKYYIPSGRCIQSLDYSNQYSKYPEEELDNFVDWIQENKKGGIETDRLDLIIKQMESRTKTPDSLLLKFNTLNGRVVKDGGGIYPDIKTEKENLSGIGISLRRENLIFDFATEFRLKNKNLTPVDKFNITDEIFEEFKVFLEKKEYNYRTDTEEGLKLLEEIAEHDSTLFLISNDLETISKKIKNNRGYHLLNNKQEISEYIASEIVSRYYYQKGRIQQDLKSDIDVKKAVQILTNLEEYNKILNVTP